MLSAVFYAAGYTTGLAAFLAMARRRHMATAGTLQVMAVGLIGGLAAGNVAQWAFTFSPGKSILGAVAGGYIAVILYKRRIGLARPTGDLFAVALCAGEAVGRWGCYFGGCCYGKPAGAFLAVWQHNAWRYPTQIYLSIACLLILACLLLFDRLKPPENSLMFLHGVLYSGARLGIEFLREGPRLAVGLSTAQFACLAWFVFCGFKLYQNLSATRLVMPTEEEQSGNHAFTLRPHPTRGTQSVNPAYTLRPNVPARGTQSVIPAEAGIQKPSQLDTADDPLPQLPV